MFSFFVRTESDRKRDEYNKLHGNLQRALDKHDKIVAEAEAAYSSYTGSVPNLSNTKVPSNDFDPKREELTRKLSRYLSDEKRKRSDLVSAKNQAYQRYVYYKNLALREAEERAEKRRKALEDFFGYGKR
ncbi:hypothetical protein [Sporosarcina pasteurii]|uniref:Flagellar FliJ protein n=1 Tax=Sporosarcina pasteurii TaxID=1474 RepID=A0A380BBA3_SPOPA|nr:hypothetical protein [Sporosarcina pasteurii]MDS9473273.1 chorismate synthase [Sporosarcina pasteurii]QBQ06505.1 hypothetical protein E2C16_12985 [Sporosarcina pasteurii]SUI98304.1 Uncharacterised protein [Sporosarcina pasteurii]